MERRQVVHPGDVGGALQAGQGLGGLLHAGVQVADDGLDPTDRLALEFQLQPQHAVGRWVLRPHVDDLPLCLVDRVVHLEVVNDEGAALCGEPRIVRLGKQLLRPLVRRPANPLGFLGSGDPDVMDLAALCSRLGRLPTNGGCLCGRGFQIPRHDVGCVAHEALCAPLN